MKVLFLHQNFPGQFAHLAPALAAQGHEVTALASRFAEPRNWKGVRILSYRHADPKDARHHPWLQMMNRAVTRGEACYRGMDQLSASGYRPDVVIAHSGWGEALCVKDVWPDVPLGVFSELFYEASGSDVGFDPEFRTAKEFGGTARVRFRNLAMRMQLEAAEAGLSPTRYQADTHPPELRDKLTVIHDGIDTRLVRPDAAARFPLPDGSSLGAGDEVITFVNRNLEPYRGYHSFMRALPELLRARPEAQVVLVGEDGVSYGPPPAEGTWKQIYIDEVRPRIPDADWARVHFVGRIPYADFIALLQVSTVHVYLTYPFVLSWSLMESMAAECAIVASDTAPVREVIRDGETGVLVDFFDPAGLAATVAGLAADAPRRHALGRAARERIVAEYDLQDICLPRQFAWVQRLAASGR